MIQLTPLSLALAATAVSLTAQSNAVTGLDGRMTGISNFTVLGTNANEVGFAARNDMCNVGSVDIPWRQAMSENHPKFGFLLLRELNGRFEQISDRSFCKHAFLSINGSGVCGTCQNPGTGQLMGINCTDAYGVGNNGDRFWLGPADEIDPWLGTWNHVGSYFDRGFPDVGAPQNTDGLRSTITPVDNVMNRVTVQKSDLVAGATYFYQIHLLHEGEPLANRGDNLMSRGTQISGGGSSWSAGDVGAATHGSVLTRWSGATVGEGSNGTDDGRIFVAGKATETSPGNWRFEYAVHNADNSRGAATFRVPVCPTSTASNFFFRDIDTNLLNQWTAARVGNEIVFTAPANNPLNWNMVYNFGFDCDGSPGAGDTFVDQARVGPGALTMTVSNCLVPNGAPVSNSTVTDLGPGCGTPTTRLFAQGLPTIPNPAQGLLSLAAPNAAVVLAYSLGTGNQVLAPGCVQYLDPAATFAYGFYLSSSAGVVQIPFPIPANIQPFSINFQVVQLIPGGPVLGNFGLSNGLQLATTLSGGCP